MPAPTYDLHPGAPGGSTYLRDISTLVEEVLEKGRILGPLTRAYGEFVARTSSAGQPLYEESLLDFLMLGILWRARGREVSSQSPSQRNLVTELVRERRLGFGKRRDGSQNPLLALEIPCEATLPMPRLSDLVTLTEWLLATGEYDDEVKRLDHVLQFVGTLHGHTETTLELILTLASDFETRADRHLGRYTTNVNRFLLEQLPARKSREDAAQCSRRRIEYHLSMVGAELLNRAWQREYLACCEQVVVLPGCLRARDEAGCRAIRTETELHCAHCNSECVVSRATRVAARYGKTTVAVAHGSDFSQFLKAAVARGRNTGIVGVACAPGLLGAGLRAKELGIPAQCIVLDASGCGHWKARGAPSAFDTRELGRILAGEPRPSEVVCDAPPSTRELDEVTLESPCFSGG
jgi:uncharacterized protein